MMKRMTTFALALLLCCTCSLSARAEAALYAIRDLPGMTPDRWQATYEAHGRTIAIDAPIHIPDVQAAPVLAVRCAPPVPEPLYSELKAWCTQSLRQDSVNRYAFLSNDFRTGVTHKTPPGWGKTRDSQYLQGTMGWNSTALFDQDPNAAYAEANPLTLAEAVRIAQEKVAVLFPDAVLTLQHAAVFDRNFWVSTHEPINEKGRYYLELAQVFHGIPMEASIRAAFFRRPISDADYRLYRRGFVTATVYDEDAWSFSSQLYQEVRVLHEDIPLLPFGAVMDRVEEKIRSGHVRWVDKVSLGYVAFDSEAEEEQVLVPAWVVWCEYHQAGAASQRNQPLYTESLFSDGTYYRALIINAQTGEMIDPESVAISRSDCPEIKTR